MDGRSNEEQAGLCVWRRRGRMAVTAEVEMAMLAEVMATAETVTAAA